MQLIDLLIVKILIIRRISAGTDRRIVKEEVDRNWMLLFGIQGYCKLLQDGIGRLDGFEVNPHQSTSKSKVG
jgi:hypothetical protein